MIHQLLSPDGDHPQIPEIVSTLPCSSGVGRHILLFVYFYKEVIFLIDSLVILYDIILFKEFNWQFAFSLNHFYPFIHNFDHLSNNYFVVFKCFQVRQFKTFAVFLGFKK